MKNSNPLLIIGLLVNILITILIKASGRYDILFFEISMIFIFLNIIGWLLIFYNKVRLGAIIYIIGCVLFIPLGIIGIIGAKKSMNNYKINKFKNKEYGSN